MSFKQRLSDLQVFSPDFDMRGGLPMNELPIGGLPGSIVTRFVDSALIPVQGRIKTLCIVVDTAITSGGAQQATVQLFAARTPFSVLGTAAGQPSGAFAGGVGAASQFPTSGSNAASAVGLPVAFAGSVASIPVGIYWFSSTFPGNPSASPPTSMTELSAEYPVLGIEITAPAAFTAGLARAFFEIAPL